MAAASSTATGEMTILRIKRKQTDDPLNALVVHNMKKKRVEGMNADDFSDGNSLFNYSGTVDEAQISTTKHVVKNFQFIYQQTVRHVGEAVRKKVERRETQRECQKLSRYRIVTEKRPDIASIGDLPLLEDNEIERMYRIYDVVAEENNENAQSKDDSMSSEDKILCNNVEMLREKLHIGDTVQPKEEDCFVYDLYLAHGGAIVMADNEIINVEECTNPEYEFVDNIEVNDEQYYDDEDDENAEDNWRNQYPEDESHSSGNESSENGDESGNSSGDEDHVYSRYQARSARLQFDPYAPTLQEDYYYTVADDEPGDET